MQYSAETLDECLDEIKGYIQNQRDEIATFEKRLELDPDWEKYRLIEGVGGLKCFVARDNGRMVSYLVYFVTPHIHYKNDICAQCDSIYTIPEYRNGVVTKGLVEYSERLLTSSGVSYVILNLKNWMNMGSFCTRMGYEAVETAYMKKL